MRKQALHHTVYFSLVKCFLIIFLSSVVVCANAQSGALTAIANKNGSPASIKLTELKSVLMGEQQRWRNGTKVLIALMKTSTGTGKNVCRKIYDMSGDELNKYWLSLVFQGKAEAPVFFNTVSELQTFVAQNAGAIGIVEQSAPLSDLKVIMVDGQKSF